MATVYQFDRADTTGARFTLDRGEQAFAVYFWLAPAALLTVFAGQVWFGAEAADRVYAYGLIALAFVCVAVSAVLARRPSPAAVLRFDNASRTLRFEDAGGRLIASTPYAGIGPFTPGRVSDNGSDGRGRTYYTIAVTLQDGRHLSLDGNTSEEVRDTRLATLRQLVALTPAPPLG